jgi:hypothetical protein
MRSCVILYLGKYTSTKPGLVFTFACIYQDIQLARKAINNFPKLNSKSVCFDILSPSKRAARIADDLLVQTPPQAMLNLFRLHRFLMLHNGTFQWSQAAALFEVCSFPP